RLEFDEVVLVVDQWEEAAATTTRTIRGLPHVGLGVTIPVRVERLEHQPELLRHAGVVATTVLALHAGVVEAVDVPTSAIRLGPGESTGSPLGVHATEQGPLLVQELLPSPAGDVQGQEDLPHRRTDSAADSAVHARRFIHEMVELGHVQATDTLENQVPMIRQVGDLTIPRSPRDNVGAPLLASHRLLTRRRLR